MVSNRSLAVQQPQVRVVTGANVPSQKRKMRSPRHTFQLKAKPYEVVPMMIAPVVPGESLDNLLIQARVVSDPIKNSLIAEELAERAGLVGDGGRPPAGHPRRRLGLEPMPVTVNGPRICNACAA